MEAAAAAGRGAELPAAPASAAAIVSLNWPRYHSVGTDGRGLRFEIC